MKARNYRDLVLRYGVAAVSITLATWVRLLLDPALGIQFPYATVFFAVLLTAWYGGFGPALAAVILGALSSAYFLIPPRGSFVVAGWDQQVGMALYVMTGLGIAVLGGTMRAAQERAERRKEAERLQRERLHVTLQSIGDAVITTDSEGRVTLLNPVAQALTGWSQEQAQGVPLENVFRIINEATRQAVENPAQRAVKEGVIVGLANHTLLISKDGTERPIDDSAAPIRDATGEVVGGVLVFRDISQRKRAEEALRRSESRKSAVLNAALDAILTIDGDGKVVEFNPAAESLFGYPLAEAVGADLGDLIIPPHMREGHRRGMAHYLATGEAPVMNKRLEMPARCKDGSEITVELVIARLEGERPLFTGFLRDVTARKKSEEALAERMRLLALDADVGSALVQSDILPDMLQRCAVALIKHLDGAFARIWTLNSQEDTLELQASAGLYTHLDGPHSRVPVGQYKIGLIAQERQPHLTNAVASDPRVSDQAWAEREGMIAFAGYPLIVEDRLVGVMAMFARKPLTASTLEAMASVANGIALGIERKRVEVRLREQREWLRTTLSSIGDAVVATDTAGRVTFLNPVAEALTGWPQAEAQGADLEAVFRIINEQTRQSVENPVAKVLREGQMVGLANHTLLIARDGAERPIDDSAAPIRDEQGTLQGVVLVFRDITDKKQAEQEVRRAGEQARIILESITDAFCALDRDWRFRYVNRQAEVLLGRSRDDLIGKNHWEEYPATLGTDVERHYRRAIAENVTARFEFFYPTHDRWYECHAYPSPEGLSVYFRDVGDRKRAEIALRQSEEKLRLLADSIPQLAWMARPDGSIFWYNRRWHEYTGTTLDQMQGWGWQSVHDPEQLPKVLERWQASIASGEPFEMVFPLKGADGRFRSFLTRVNPLQNDEGHILYWFGTNTDISEMKEMEAALREKEARLRAIFEGSLDGIVMTDDEGRYVEANPGASDLFGLSREELLGRRIPDFAELDFPFDQAWQAFRRGGHSTGEFRLVRPDGTIKDVEFAATADILPGRHLSIIRDVTQRKKAERALREVEARFAAVINHSPSCIFVKDRQGRYLLGNRALAQMVGREPDDFLGRTDADFFPPEIVAQFGNDDAEILKDGRPRIYEESFPQAGTLVTALTVKFPLMDTDGTVYGVCGIATDITAQKRANEALAVSEERLRLALEAGRMGVWDWNVRTNEIKWSDNMEPIHGLAPGTFGGTFEAYQKLIHPDDRELVAGAIGKAVEERSGYAVEFRNVWPDSSVHWIAGQGKVFTAEDGQPVRMIGVGMDVTKRKRSEQTARFLADASSTLASLVDYESTLQKVATLAVPFFADWATVDIAEEDGLLRRVAVAHVDPSKVELGRDVNRRFPPDPAASQGLWNILRTGKSEIVSDITDDLLVATVKDEELLRIMRELGLKSYMGVPLKVRGESLGVITFIAAESGRLYDATDLAVAEDLAHRAGIAIENAQLYRELKDADRKKDEFLAVLAHELRNPLAPLSNALQVMRLTATNGQAEQVRDMMERQVRQMTRLVDDLLDISRITSGKIVLRKERLDLSEVILSALETSRPLIEAGKHELTITPPQKPLLVEGDKTRLAQVLSNLLTNSAKYTPEGGRIWLTVERHGQEALIRVRDNGTGIPAQMLPRIFDMFTQVDRNLDRSQGGLGIGLTLVRSLVGMHSGSVEARSEGPGRGSEFIVRLPLMPDKPEGQRVADERETEPQAADDSTRRRILVVDDNVDSAESLAMMLRLSGNEVRTAHDGPTALAVAAAFFPEVVLLDIGLPGIDGYEVARRMRMMPSLKAALLVAQTGWGQEEDRRRSDQAGFDHHFTKPVDPAALQALLASLDSTEKKR